MVRDAMLAPALPGAIERARALRARNYQAHGNRNFSLAGARPEVKRKLAIAMQALLRNRRSRGFAEAADSSSLATAGRLMPAMSFMRLCVFRQLISAGFRHMMIKRSPDDAMPNASTSSSISGIGSSCRDGHKHRSSWAMANIRPARHASI